MGDDAATPRAVYQTGFPSSPAIRTSAWTPTLSRQPSSISTISHALAGGRTLAEVRDAAGHSSVLVTSAYLHVAVDDDGNVGNLFQT